MRRSRGPEWRALTRRWAPWILGALALALLAYIVLHSPLRPYLNQLIGAQGHCYILCGRAEALAMADRGSVALLIGAALIGAWAIVTSLSLCSYERLPAWGLLSFALLAVPAAVVGAVGDLIGVGLLRPPAGPLIATIPGAVAIGWAVRRGWRPGWPTHGRPSLAPLTVLLGVVAIGLIVLSAGVSLSHPPTGYDELGYHAPIAVMLWRDGVLSSPITHFPASFALAHPATAELWYGALRLLGGESIANLGQLPFALMAAAGVAAFGRRLGLSRRGALVAGTCFLAAPLVVVQIGRQANDVTAAAVLITLAALAAAPLREWTAGRIALVGLGMGLLGVIKVALLPGVAAIGLVLVVTAVVLWRANRQAAPDRAAGDRSATSLPTGAEGPYLPQRSIAVGLLAAALLFLVAVGPWWLRNLAAFGNPVYPAAIPLIKGVNWHAQRALDFNFVPSRLLWPFYPLLEPHANNSGLGGAFAIAVVPGVVLAALRGVRRPLWIVVAVTVLSLPAWWLYTRHEPRFLLGLAGLLFATLPFVLSAVGRRWQTLAAGLLGLAAIFSAGVTLTTQLAAEAAKPTDRVEFYATVWGIDPAVQLLPDSVGVIVDDTCGVGLVARVYPLLGTSGERIVARISCGATAEKVVKALRKWNLQTVYAVTTVARSGELDARYPSAQFTLVSRSVVPNPKKSGPQLDRRIYRLNAP